MRNRNRFFTAPDPASLVSCGVEMILRFLPCL